MDKLNKENDLIVLLSFIAIGIIIASGLAAILQSIIIVPVTIFGFVMFPLILLQNRPKVAHITENIEKVIFFITLFILVISFILLYKPL